jgi:hypothetical protein
MSVMRDPHGPSYVWRYRRCRYCADSSAMMRLRSMEHGASCSADHRRSVPSVNRNAFRRCRIPSRSRKCRRTIPPLRVQAPNRPNQATGLGSLSMIIRYMLPVGAQCECRTDFVGGGCAVPRSMPHPFREYSPAASMRVSSPGIAVEEIERESPSVRPYSGEDRQNRSRRAVTPDPTIERRAPPIGFGHRGTVTSRLAPVR